MTLLEVDFIGGDGRLAVESARRLAGGWQVRSKGGLYRSPLAAMANSATACGVRPCSRSSSQARHDRCHSAVREGRPPPRVDRPDSIVRRRHVVTAGARSSDIGPGRARSVQGWHPCSGQQSCRTGTHAGQATAGPAVVPGWHSRRPAIGPVHDEHSAGSAPWCPTGDHGESAPGAGLPLV